MPRAVQTSSRTSPRRCIAYSVFTLGGIIAIEGAIAFLGLSVRRPPSWGNMISEASSDLDAPMLVLILAPAIALFLTLVSPQLRAASGSASASTRPRGSCEQRPTSAGLSEPEERPRSAGTDDRCCSGHGPADDVPHAPRAARRRRRRLAHAASRARRSASSASPARARRCCPGRSWACCRGRRTDAHGLGPLRRQRDPQRAERRRCARSGARTSPWSSRTR